MAEGWPHVRRLTAATVRDLGNYPAGLVLGRYQFGTRGLGSVPAQCFYAVHCFGLHQGKIKHLEGVSFLGPMRWKRWAPTAATESRLLSAFAPHA